MRVTYAAAPQARMINLLAIGPRGNIYQRFDFPGWDSPETAMEFGPEMAAQPDHLLFAPEDLTRYVEGTRAAFLLHLDKQQEPLTSWALASPTLRRYGTITSGKVNKPQKQAKNRVENWG